jgi:hypothetical protein
VIGSVVGLKNIPVRNHLCPNRAVVGSGNCVRVNNIVGLSQLFPITAQAPYGATLLFFPPATISMNVVADTAAGQ